MEIIRLATNRIVDGPPIRGDRSAAGLGAVARALDHLPPIAVQAGTWRLVDGAQRLAAARSLGRDEVKVEMVVVGDDELLAERARRNNGAGALTRSERRTVAIELLEQHPEWSDRRIGSCVGVAGTTIGRLRDRAGAPSQHLHTDDARIGSDGRRYRSDTAPAKAHAARLHSSDPQRSLNSIAREVGLSPATVKRALATHPVDAGNMRSAALPDPDALAPPLDRSQPPGLARFKTAGWSRSGLWRKLVRLARVLWRLMADR